MPLESMKDSPTAGSHHKLVASHEEGTPLYHWVREHFQDLSYSALQKCVRQGRLRIDAQVIRSNTPLHAGQEVELRDRRAQPSEHALPSASPKDAALLRSLILYEDAHCCVLNKPAKLAVQGGSKIRHSVDALLEAHFAETGERWLLVHRLDRLTSGLLLIAKGRVAAAHWASLFRDHHLQKTYLALTHGVPTPEEGNIEAPLHKKRLGGEEYMAIDPEGLPSETEYQVKEKRDPYALLLLRPKTGRRHQLRVHCATVLGCPIVGDKKYGGPPLPGKRESPLCLHAYQLRAPGLPLLTAPLPGWMEGWTL
ncbi:MAG: RluA family pseudouridine synthase [Holosporales bacterium]|jgi:23S rRNA pseudouridine955/2504/2580 synthase|nr:RluA family pseudouridine synthase [Holosporales bacterium]